MSRFEKVVISGCLQVVTDLHTGGGEQYEMDQTTGFQLVNGSLLSLPRAVDGRLFIRGSSLRGKLRSLADELRYSVETQNELFGSSIGDVMQSGAIRVEDCLVPSDVVPIQRNGNSIENLLGAAREHMLFQVECIPAGTEIPIELRCGRISEKGVVYLMGLLQCIDGGPGSGLGALSNKGYGRLRFRPGKCKVLTAKRVAQWLVTDDCALDDYFAEDDGPAWPELVVVPQCSLAIKIHTESPIVINEPDEDRKRGDGPAIRTARTQPDGRFALIPGTSLAGICRSRARRILMSIVQHQVGTLKEPVEQCVDDYIDDVFGTERLSSYVRFGQARSVSPVLLHRRLQIAIDRLTGKASGSTDKKRDEESDAERRAGGALVEIEAALNSTYSADVSINLTRREPIVAGWKALLAFLLRDAMEGDLHIGSGRSRGFGGFSLEVEFDGHVFSQWDELQAHIETRTDIDLCEEVAALHSHFDAVLSDLENIA